MSGPTGAAVYAGSAVERVRDDPAARLALQLSALCELLDGVVPRYAWDAVDDVMWQIPPSRFARAALATGAVVLALAALGGGGALLATSNPTIKGLGLGLMIGWAFLSIVSVGFCTGLNPGLYT